MVSIQRNPRIKQETKIGIKFLATYPTDSCVLIFVVQSLAFKMNDICIAQYYVKYHVTLLVPHHFSFFTGSS